MKQILDDDASCFFFFNILSHENINHLRLKKTTKHKLVNTNTVVMSIRAQIPET